MCRQRLLLSFKLEVEATSPLAQALKTQNPTFRKCSRHEPLFFLMNPSWKFYKEGVCGIMVLIHGLRIVHSEEDHRVNPKLRGTIDFEISWPQAVSVSCFWLAETLVCARSKPKAWGNLVIDTLSALRNPVTMWTSLTNLPRALPTGIQPSSKWFRSKAQCAISYDCEQDGCCMLLSFGVFFFFFFT